MDNLGFISRDSPVYVRKTRLQKSTGQIAFMMLCITKGPEGIQDEYTCAQARGLHNQLIFSPERVEFHRKYFNMSKIIPALFCIFRLNLI